MKLAGLFLTVVFLVFTVAVSAQEEMSVKTEDKLRSELEQKAKNLTEEVLLEIPQLESNESRIILSTLVIDLLWSEDEKRARQIARETAVKLRAELSPTLEKEPDIRGYLLYPPRQSG